MEFLYNTLKFVGIGIAGVLFGITALAALVLDILKYGFYAAGTVASLVYLAPHSELALKLVTMMGL